VDPISGTMSERNRHTVRCHETQSVAYGAFMANRYTFGICKRSDGPFGLRRCGVIMSMPRVLTSGSKSHCRILCQQSLSLWQLREQQGLQCRLQQSGFIARRLGTGAARGGPAACATAMSLER
jgi:hypothetical protein